MFTYQNQVFYTEEALDLVLQTILEEKDFETLLNLPLTEEQAKIRKEYLHIWFLCEDHLDKNLILTIRKYL